MNQSGPPRSTSQSATCIGRQSSGPLAVCVIIIAVSNSASMSAIFFRVSMDASSQSMQRPYRQPPLSNQRVEECDVGDRAWSEGLGSEHQTFSHGPAPGLSDEVGREKTCWRGMRARPLHNTVV